MSNEIFTPMEIDAIGEIMNISLGSSATAVSNMLDHRVDITTPTVSIVDIDDFSLGEIKPAICVVINYVAGLEGSNVMLLKRSDIKVIVDILMGTETADEDFVLDELTISAACEVMNQMMGASATAMSDFLGRLVNISTPQSFELADLEQFKREQLASSSSPLVIVRFALNIEGALQSEFMNIMSVKLARELVSGFGLGEDEDSSMVTEIQAPDPGEGGRVLSEEEIAKMMQEANAQSAPTPPPAESGGGKLSQEEIEKLMQSNAAPTPPPAAPSGGKLSQEEIEKLMQANAAPTPPPAESGGGKLSQEEIEKLMQANAAPTPPPAAPSGGKLSQEEIEKLMQANAAPAAPTPQMGGEYQMPPNPYMPQGGMPYPGMPYGYPPYPYGAEGYPMMQQPPMRVVSTQTPDMQQMNLSEKLGEEQAQNLDLIMNVPLEVTVEIGRTRRKVQEILGFSKGSLVVLDKLAGDQVDLFVNGKCIARGDVVVIDDNFGIRITEILQNGDLAGIVKE